MEQREPPTHFVCSIGLGNYMPAIYTRDGRTCSTSYAPVAVARLCGLAPGRATVLATPQAEQKHFASLRDELQAVGFTVTLASMNEGVTREDFTAILAQLIELIDEGERVVLDITFAFRHLPFTYFAALTYLSAFKRIEVAGVYYGAWEQGTKDAEGVLTAPIRDLTPMFELAQWSYALESVNRSGDLRPLQRAFTGAVRNEKGRTHARSPLEQMRPGLNALAPALAAGLPLEVGIAARRLLDALHEMNIQSLEPEFAPLSLRPLAGRLADWAVPEGVSTKSGIVLNRAELERQLRLIRWYAERENVQEALLLLREWLVSRAIQHAGAVDWLGYARRKAYEGALNAAAERDRHNIATGDMGRLWQQVTDARNYLAHADTDLNVKPPTPERIGGWVDRCEALLDSPLDLQPPGRDRLLVSPLGLTPGVIFTAATHVRPDQAIIITSADAEAAAAEALAVAGMPALPRVVCSLSDPFAGIDEARGLAESLRPKLTEARELMVNLTGGTTAMQMVVERLAQAAARLGIPVKRIFLIDRRPREEQERDPYVLGEVVWLDGEADA